MPQVTREQLMALAHYDPETGFFTRLKPTGSRWRFPAGTRFAENTKGYPQIRVDGRTYAAHRLVWLYVHGEFPKGEIDHINRDRRDNRLVNLRIATHAENLKNGPKKRFNTSGLKGVHWHKQGRSWRARICVDWKYISLGCFDCPAAAHLAYVVASDKYHGQFGRID